MDAPSVDPEARLLVGVSSERRSQPVSARHRDEYLAAADDWNPLYHDETFAVDSEYRETVTPPLFVLAASRRVQPRSRLLEDGQYDDLTIPGLHGRSVLASWDVDIKRLVRVGDVITVREMVTSIEEKIGKSGPLILVTKRSTHVNQDGHELAVETQTIIYR